MTEAATIFQEEALRLDGADGLAFRLWHWRGPRPPHGVVQILHGLGEHAARYRPMAEILGAAGFAVIAHDQRGHGQSRRNDSESGLLGDQGGWGLALDDARRVADAVKARYPQVPHFLMGHSMGSFMTQDLMPTDAGRFAGIILSGTDGPPGALEAFGRVLGRIERLRLGPRGHSDLIHRLSFDAFNRPFRPTRTEYDWLSRDLAEVDQFLADTACGYRIPVQTMIDIVDALPRLTRASRLARIAKTKPILVVSGDADPVGKMGKGPARLAAIYRRAGLRDITLKLYPDARHELMHETNREEFVRDLIAWLEIQVDKA